MTLIISGDITLRKGWQPMDPDAAAYITEVESADDQALEEPVKIAIDNFVLGCKADGIWNAIKASCILAGARTLNGALVPLVGAAPTDYNFFSGDYNRKTGLKGDGTSKHIDSNRAANADPQNSKHVAVYATQVSSSLGCLIGHRPDSSTDVTQIIDNPGTFTRTKVNGSNFAEITGAPLPGLFGGKRSNSTQVTARNNSTSVTAAATSLAPSSDSVIVFARRTDSTIEVYSDARLAFYSIGESLDLALLDARVTDLINKFAEVIP